MKEQISPLAKTKIFTSNRSQCVRLPKTVAFPDNVVEVEVIIDGNRRVISPAGRSWDCWFANDGATADFMNARNQPTETAEG